MPRPVRSVLATALFLALSFTLLPTAHAQTACTTEFGDALTAIEQALLSQGNAQKISTKVRNAWRTYATASQNATANAVKELKVADDLIDGNSMKAVSPGVKDALHAAIGAVRTCITSAPAVQTTTLTVRVLAITGEEPTETPKPVGANAAVTVAGVTGKTKGDSTVALKVPVGRWNVYAELGTSGGYAVADLTAGTPAQVDVVLLPNGRETPAVIMTSAEIIDGALPHDFTALTLKLENDLGEAIAVDGIANVEIRVAASEMRDVTAMFRASGGAISLSDRAAFAAFVLARIDPFELRVIARDKQKNEYSAALTFAIGRFRPTPAITGAAPANVSFRLFHERSQLAFYAVSGANGSVTWPLLPDGPYLMQAETVQGGQRLYARDGFVLDANKSVPVKFFAMTATSSRTPAVVSASSSASKDAIPPGSWGRVEADGTVVALNAPPKTFRIEAVDLETDRSFGTFRPLQLHTIDWPEPLPQRAEEDLVAFDAEAAKATVAADDRERVSVTVRGFDAAGNVMYRDVVPVTLETREEGLHHPDRPEPSEEQQRRQFEARRLAPKTRRVEFRIYVPAGTDMIEVRGWRPGQVVLLKLAELRGDPAVAKIETLRSAQ